MLAPQIFKKPLFLDLPMTLCDICSKICFDALRGPSVTQLEQARREGSDVTTSGAKPDKVDLGSLDGIEKRAMFCGLCRLFNHVLNRQGNLDILRENGVFLRADPDLSYYGYVFDNAGRQ